jgi:WD40 repeat protein
MMRRKSLIVAALIVAAPAAAAPEAKPKAGPVIGAANVDRIRSVAEVEPTAVRALRPGPGRGELALLGGRNGLEIVDDAALRPLRSIDADRPEDFAVSKDGRMVAWSEPDGHIYIREAAGGAPRKVKVGHHPFGLAWSPDGKVMAVGDTINENPKVEGSGETRVRLFDAKGELVRTLPATTLGFPIPVFSPDGTRLVIGCVNTHTRIVEVATGKVLHTLPRRLATQTMAVAIRPDGKAFATAHADGDIELWDLATGELLRSTKGTRPYTSLDWSPAGDLLLTACSDRIELWDPERLAPVKELKAPFAKPFATTARFSADGRRVISLTLSDHTAAADRKLAIWAVADERR